MPPTVLTGLKMCRWLGRKCHGETCFTTACISMNKNSTTSGQDGILSHNEDSFKIQRRANAEENT